MLKRALAVLPFLLSCAHVPPRITHVVDCSVTKIESQLPAIAAEVAADLLAENYAALLFDLGQRVGQDVVLCAVQEAAKKRFATMPRAQASVIHAHAEAWLKTQGAK